MMNRRPNEYAASVGADKSFSALLRGGQGFRMRWVHVTALIPDPRLSPLTPALAPRWSAGTVPGPFRLSQEAA
jgi:hypothetical protein